MTSQTQARGRLMMVAMLLLAGALWAEETADPLAQLETLLPKISSYTFGQSRADLSTAADIVAHNSQDSGMRKKMEKKLARLLDESQTTRDGKEFVCRQLMLIGTQISVPALSRLLTDSDLSHMARYALENIPDEEASQALRETVSATEGRIRVGIINSIGVRKDTRAVSLLVPLLKDADGEVARASAISLGKIGGSEALEALRSGLKDSSQASMPAVADACLACADQLLAQGKAAQASDLFEEISKAAPLKSQKVSCFLGRTRARASEAGPMIVEALKGEDVDLREAAALLARELPGETLTQFLASQLPGLPPDAQVTLILCLADRQDNSALSGVKEMLKSDSLDVRIAALKALGTLGDASCVSLLSEAAAKGQDPEKQAGLDSLRRLRGKDINGAIQTSMENASPEIQKVLIETLGARNATESVPALLQKASVPEASARVASLKSLGLLATDKEIPALFDLLTKASEASEKEEAEKAIISVIRRMADPGSVVATLAPKRTSQMDLSMQKALLRILGATGHSSALVPLREALKSSQPEIQDTSVRLLADWPTAEPCEDLMGLIKSTSNNTHRVLALRGVVRMAGVAGPDQATAILLQAMGVASNAEDKKLVLSGMKAAKGIEALDAVNVCLSDAAVAAEASVPAVSIAKDLVATHPQQVAEAMNKVIAVSKDEKTLEEARKILEETQKTVGYVSVWEGSGPFTVPNKTGKDLFDIVFAPERTDGTAEWSLLKAGMSATSLDLSQGFKAGPNQCAYVRSVIQSPEDANVLMEVGSDDGIKVWLNGIMVYANNAARALTLDEDKLNARLKKGPNALMLKVVQNEADWAASVRIRKEDGSLLQGMKFEGNPPENLVFILEPELATPVDFTGDYQGEWKGQDGKSAPLFAQVMGLAGGAYKANLLKELDKRIEATVVMDGDLLDGSVALSGQADRGDMTGTAWTGTLTPQLFSGQISGALSGSFELKKIQRTSPTMGAQPPAGAVVLFDGKSLDNWTRDNGAECRWRLLEDGAMEVLPGSGSVISKPSFGDHQLHIEFRTPYMPDKGGQARGNSGVYLMSRYEVQILDSFGLYGYDNECGGVYKVAEPLVNMCYPPMVWQTYDVTFTAPRADAEGKKIADARLTVIHNGVLIHKDIVVPNPTGSAPKATVDVTGPLYLQDHGNKVQFRNIWVVETR